MNEKTWYEVRKTNDVSGPSYSLGVVTQFNSTTGAEICILHLVLKDVIDNPSANKDDYTIVTVKSSETIEVLR